MMRTSSLESIGSGPFSLAFSCGACCPSARTPEPMRRAALPVWVTSVHTTTSGSGSLCKQYWDSGAFTPPLPPSPSLPMCRRGYDTIKERTLSRRHDRSGAVSCSLSDSSSDCDGSRTPIGAPSNRRGAPWESPDHSHVGTLGNGPRRICWDLLLLVVLICVGGGARHLKGVLLERRGHELDEGRTSEQTRGILKGWAEHGRGALLHLRGPDAFAPGVLERLARTVDGFFGEVSIVSKFLRQHHCREISLQVLQTEQDCVVMP